MLAMLETPETLSRDPGVGRASPAVRTVDLTIVPDDGLPAIDAGTRCGLRRAGSAGHPVLALGPPRAAGVP